MRGASGVLTNTGQVTHYLALFSPSISWQSHINNISWMKMRRMFSEHPWPRHDSIYYLHSNLTNHRKLCQSRAVRSGIRRTRNIISGSEISTQTNISAETSRNLSLSLCSLVLNVQTCDRTERSSDLQMTCLSSQSNLGYNVSWHCFATIKNNFAKFRKFIKKNCFQWCNQSTCQMYFYILWISYFVVSERLIICHFFVTFCRQLCRGKNIQRLENICIVQIWKYLGLG